MLSSWVVAAWANLRRDRLHAAINIVGLALGFAVAILIGLYVRDELSYDRFLPQHDLLFRLTETIALPGRDPIAIPGTDAMLPALLQRDFSEIEAVSRLGFTVAAIRRGAVEETGEVHEADPNFLTLLGLTLRAGDPATALDAPDSVVLSDSAARKWFGAISPLGETLDIDGHPMRVTGVMPDLPSATHLAFDIIVSGRAPFSVLAQQDASPTMLPATVLPYLKLKRPGDADAVAARLPAFLHDRMLPLLGDSGDPTLSGRWLTLMNVADIHLYSHTLHEMRPPGDVQSLWVLAAVGLLVLAVAGSNFVTLLTARAGRRSVEITVRKAVGASRAQLFGQFMAETLAASFAALVVAIAAVELALPAFGAFLGRRLDFDYWQEPGLAAVLVGLAIITGLAAGFYPALVLSGLRPAVALRGPGGALGAGRLRQVLVIAQFAISIGLVAATLVMERQAAFAVQQSLLLGSDPIVLVSLGDTLPRSLVETLVDRFSALPEIAAAGASFSVPTDFSTALRTVTLTDAPTTATVSLSEIAADPGFFAVYGLQPVAGRLLARDRAGDGAPDGPVILNEAAVRVLGFASTPAAIGRHIETDGGRAAEIVGVVPNLLMKSVRQPVEPAFFRTKPASINVISLRITAAHVPEALAAIDAAWGQLVPDRPIRRIFLDQRIEALYREIVRQGQVFAAFAAVTAAIACLGLFGLSAFSAERRTKEIGIRKALGASARDIVLLLVWQFVRPVALAAALAAPLAWLVMQRWLDGFAERVALDPAIFLLAGLAALAIAIATTAFHALQVARARPVEALRYE